jgi:hypothetical protein
MPNGKEGETLAPVEVKSKTETQLKVEKDVSVTAVRRRARQLRTNCEV